LTGLAKSFYSIPMLSYYWAEGTEKDIEH